MNKPKIVALAAGVVGLGTAAAVAGYRATHPSGASGPVSPDGDRSRPALAEHLFDLPEGLTEHHVKTPDGASIHVIEKGAGRPLLLLHGVMLRSDVWAPQFHHLADHYRVLAADLRGHGSSTAGKDGYGIGPLAADVAAVLEDLDLRDAIVVGHSMGGMGIMGFCGDHPEVLAERVAGLVFLATAADRLLPAVIGPGARLLLERGQAMVDRGRDLPARTTVTPRLTRLAFGDRPSAKAVAIVTEMGQAMAPESLVPSLAKLLDHDARVALRATRTPSLVVVGTRDLLTPVWAGRRLAKQLPDAEFVVLPRAGHQLMQERPVELAELLDAFVDRITGAEPSVAAGVARDPRPVEAAQVEAYP